MNKRRFLCCIILVCMVLSSCWDYRGLDEINIVAGLAIDRSEETGSYRLTLEIVNVSSMKNDSEADTLLVTTEGTTLFEAIRNAKKKLYNKLYLGSMRTIIISEDIAREEGILLIVDGFLRDVEPRETISLVISREDSAEKLLSAKGLDTSNVSFEIAKIIEEDSKVDSTSKKMLLYQAYNIIVAQGIELIVPAFRLVKNQKDDVIEINGVGIFKGDKLIDFMEPEDAHYFLIATDNKVGGPLSLTYSEDNPQPLSFEIKKCKSTPGFEYKNGKISIMVKVELELVIIEISTNVYTTEESLDYMKGRTKKFLEKNLSEVFYKYQKNPGVDIYGYGNRIYEDDYALWQEIGEDWEELFKDADFKADVTVGIVNIGLTN